MRGEVEFFLGSQPILLRPTFQALCSLEQESGRGILEIARRFHEGNFTLSEVVAIIKTGMVNGTLSKEQIGNAVCDAGIATLVKPLSEYLAYALGGLYAGATHASETE